MVKLYNSLKAGVDTLDQVTGSYTCRRRTDRWPLAIFFNLLDICSHNSFLTFLAAHPSYLSNDRSKKRKYLDWLSKELALSYVLKRRNTTGIQNEVINKIETFIANFDRMYGPTNSPISVCSSCSSSDGIKACSFCESVACRLHYRNVKLYVCPDCLKNQQDFPELKFINRKSRRCSFCPRSHDIKTKVNCLSCNRPVCERHDDRKAKNYDVCHNCLK